MSVAAWLSRQEIVALGWALLHFCWQGTAVALAYAVVDRATSHASSKVRYAVALAALMIMPLVVAGTFADELRIANHPHSPAGLTTDTSFNFAPAAPAAHPTPNLHELPLASSLEDQGTDWFNWIATRTDRFLPWVVALWLSGVLLLALRALGGWWQLNLVRSHAQRMVPQEVERAFQRLCQQIHAGRKVVLRASDEVISPLAMGVWRATVILPISAILTLPREELEAVIAHELGHIRRWDYLWNLLQTAIESILFFHPAVWWLSRTVRERREVCCDEIAVRSCAGAAVYARALLRLEEQRTRKLRLAMALGGCSGLLLGRVRKVLGEDIAMESRMTSGVSVAAIGALVMALLLGPKIEAVAAPIASKAQPVVAQFISALPSAIVSQPDATGGPRVAVPAPKAAPHPRIPAQPAVIAPAALTPLPPPMARLQAQLAPQIGTRFATFFAIRPEAYPGTNPILAFAFQEANGTPSQKGVAYLDGMRDAGYPLDLNSDLNSLVALKSLGVTPEYAKAMATTGLGKPSVHELISLKSMGVTPEYVASLKNTGIAPKDFREVTSEKSMGITPEYAADMKKSFGDLSLHELISMKSMGVTPEYAADVKQKGFGDVSVHDLIAMKSMGITPEYATEMKKAFGNLSLHELISMKSMGITPEYAADMKQKGFGDASVHDLIAMKSMGVTPEYAAEMKQKGFGNLNLHELISMKSMGMTPEYAGWLKQQFPQATPEELHRASVFHLDDKFIADAKAHGFNDKDLDKLLKLKMSGLLDQ
jgi:beta-lactamase regulating signal transducer with metallopeptidase domain